MIEIDDLYDTTFRVLLTEDSLDKTRRKNQINVGDNADNVRKALAFDIIDAERLAFGSRMAIIYTAIHAFENTVRDMVKSALTEKFAEKWWLQAPERIKKKVISRMEEEAKFRWHGARGGSEIEYCDFGDLSAIIVTNWNLFEDLLSDMEWTKSILSVLERSRNIVMHGGMLDRQDIERIGMNIRDWIRQTG